MKKDMNDICPPINVEEFCNITDLLFSKDKECKILAEEFLKPYVYDIIGNEIFLTKDFSIKPQFGGWFSRSDGSWSGPKIIYNKWIKELENCQK